MTGNKYPPHIKSQIRADNISFNVVKAITADCTPRSVVKDF